MAAKTTSTTVTLKHLAASLAEDNELSKKQAEAILGGLVWWAFPVAWHHSMRVGPGYYTYIPR